MDAIIGGIGGGIMAGTLSHLLARPRPYSRATTMWSPLAIIVGLTLLIAANS